MYFVSEVRESPERDELPAAARSHPVTTNSPRMDGLHAGRDRAAFPVGGIVAPPVVEEDTRLPIDVDGLLVAVRYSSTFRVPFRVDLRNLARNASNVIYKPGTAFATLKLRSPRSTCNVWRTGRMSCGDVGSEALARRASRKYARIVQLHGRPADPEAVRMLDYRVHRVIGWADTGRRVHLTRFATDFRPVVDYEPELSSNACSVRSVPGAPGVSVRVYATGKLRFECRDLDGLVKAARWIVPTIAYCSRPKNVVVAAGPLSR